MAGVLVTGSAGFIGFHLCSLLLKLLTGSTTNKPIKTGVRKFVDWYLNYYDVSK